MISRGRERSASGTPAKSSRVSVLGRPRARTTMISEERKLCRRMRRSVVPAVFPMCRKMTVGLPRVGSAPGPPFALTSGRLRRGHQGPIHLVRVRALGRQGRVLELPDQLVLAAAPLLRRPGHLAFHQLPVALAVALLDQVEAAGHVLLSVVELLVAGSELLVEVADHRPE